jgi:hypothetical protein
MRRGVKIGAGVLAALVLVLIGTGIGSAGKPAPASARPAVTQYVTPPPVTAYATVTEHPRRPKPPSKTTMSQDGVYVVGANILPGTYQTAGENGSNGAGCYYALLSSTNTSDIIDNNIVKGTATITVGPGVKAVDTEGCKTWHRIGA